MKQPLLSSFSKEMEKIALTAPGPLIRMFHMKPNSIVGKTMAKIPQPIKNIGSNLKKGGGIALGTAGTVGALGTAGAIGATKLPRDINN